jgi:hypothetical protein
LRLFCRFNDQLVVSAAALGRIIDVCEINLPFGVCTRSWGSSRFLRVDPLLLSFGDDPLEEIGSALYVGETTGRLMAFRIVAEEGDLVRIERLLALQAFYLLRDVFLDFSGLLLLGTLCLLSLQVVDDLIDTGVSRLKEIIV